MVDTTGSHVVIEGLDDNNNASNHKRKTRKSSLRKTDWLPGPEGTLYDRVQQQQALRDAYYRCKSQAEIALITGASGTGE